MHKEKSTFKKEINIWYKKNIPAKDNAYLICETNNDKKFHKNVKNSKYKYR